MIRKIGVTLALIALIWFSLPYSIRGQTIDCIKWWELCQPAESLLVDTLIITTIIEPASSCDVWIGSDSCPFQFGHAAFGYYMPKRIKPG